MPDPATPETAPPSSALEAKGLSRRFTTRAGETVGVRDVSLAIAPGELFALLGPNGSGKSTLMGMLATIDAPQAGEIVYASSDGAVAISPGATNADRRRARALVGVAFQAHILDPLLTVRENLLVAASLYGIARPQPRIDELLATLRIADRAHGRGIPKDRPPGVRFRNDREDRVDDPGELVESALGPRRIDLDVHPARAHNPEHRRDRVHAPVQGDHHPTAPLEALRDEPRRDPARLGFEVGVGQIVRVGPDRNATGRPLRPPQERRDDTVVLGWSRARARLGHLRAPRFRGTISKPKRNGGVRTGDA